jgi:hypothetical protein
VGRAALKRQFREHRDKPVHDAVGAHAPAAGRDDHGTLWRPLFSKQPRQSLLELRVHRNAPTLPMLGDGSPDLEEIADGAVRIEDHRPFECCDFAGA